MVVSSSVTKVAIFWTFAVYLNNLNNRCYSWWDLLVTLIISVMTMKISQGLSKLKHASIHIEACMDLSFCPHMDRAAFWKCRLLHHPPGPSSWREHMVISASQLYLMSVKCRDRHDKGSSGSMQKAKQFLNGSIKLQLILLWHLIHPVLAIFLCCHKPAL